MNYNESLSTHLESLKARLLDKMPISAADALAPVDWEAGKANDAFFTELTHKKILSRKEIERAAHRARVMRALGLFPASPSEFVGAYLRLHSVTVTHGGEISLLDLHAGKRRQMILTDLCRHARVTASELALQMQREAINDAVEEWFYEAREARADAVLATITGTATFDWSELARCCFVCSDTSPEFVGAVLQKFVHQVVLKLHGRPVGHHLMPVFLGPQGIGKTWFIYRFLSPLIELTREADFRMIADERNIALWRASVLVIDEMAFAERSDIETVKHVITASTLDRRPMRSNDVVSVRQNATLIGASNKTLAELIRDETGARRFVGLEYRPDADRDYLAAVDWSAAWRSVTADMGDPMEPHRDQLTKLQAETRHISPVESWLMQLDRETVALTDAKGDTALSVAKMYDDYGCYLRRTTDGQRAKSLAGFEQELGRLVKGKPAPIRKHRTKIANEWRWSGPHQTPISGGLSA